MSMHNYANINMDRENEEHVYANEEPNSHDVRTGRQISTTHQTPGNSGDSAMIRNYRAATVCLVLLCVVLLTAVIVLGTNYTQEKTKQRTKIINLTEETRQLQSDYANLINERDALLSKNNDLIKERNAFRKDGWIYKHSSFYYFSSEKKSWNESRRYCTERGADLIIINNKEEHDFVQKNINRVSLFWIGLTDIDEEGTWKWVDGSMLNIRFWWSKEPNGQRRENCALYYFSKWSDYPCNVAYLWICEKNVNVI